jgi:hypothetical protein
MSIAGNPPAHKPDVHYIRGAREALARPRGAEKSSPFFCVEMFESIDVHRLRCDDPLEAGIFFFELLHPDDIADLKAVVLGLPVAQRVRVTPCRRQISAVFPVASCSLMISTICASVKRDFLIFRSPNEPFASETTISFGPDLGG